MRQTETSNENGVLSVDLLHLKICQNIIGHHVIQSLSTRVNVKFVQIFKNYIYVVEKYTWIQCKVIILTHTYVHFLSVWQSHEDHMQNFI
jgi:hypothetical protein